MTAVRATSWSPSRLADYDQCPMMFKHKHLLKTCPLCFNGKIMGGFDTPAVCDTCGQTLKKAPAIERGTIIGDALDLYLKGEVKKPPPQIRHERTLVLVKQCRAAVKKGTGKVQLDVVLDHNFCPVKGWDKSAWLRTKLDYREDSKLSAHVIDWKTGGIDKRTGAVRAQEKYDDQLMIYNVITLVTTTVPLVTSALVFLDCGPRFDPLVQRNPLARKDLEKAKKDLQKRALPLLSDDTFAPRAGDGCRWCDFSKGKGGPCEY